MGWACGTVIPASFLPALSSWQIAQVAAGTVRVRDAQGAPPTIPFWLGEAPSRTLELSQEVSDLRRAVGGRLEGADPIAVARRTHFHNLTATDPTEKHDLSKQPNAAAAAARESLQAVFDRLPANVDLPFEPRSSSAFKLREERAKASSKAGRSPIFPPLQPSAKKITLTG